MSTKQENVSDHMPTSRHSYFHPILILHVKMVKLPQQHANTNVNWL